MSQQIQIEPVRRRKKGNSRVQISAECHGATGYAGPPSDAAGSNTVKDPPVFRKCRDKVHARSCGQALKWRVAARARATLLLGRCAIRRKYSRTMHPSATVTVEDDVPVSRAHSCSGHGERKTSNVGTSNSRGCKKPHKLPRLAILSWYLYLSDFRSSDDRTVEPLEISTL